MRQFSGILTLTPRTCLIVDDSRIIRKVARRIVEGLGFEVDEAADGSEALAFCERLFARRDPVLAQHFREAQRTARDRSSMLDVGDAMFEEVALAAGAERAASLRERLEQLLPRAPEATPGAYAAKTRYRQQDAACTLAAAPEGFALDFADAQWAVTPGQSAVLYDGEVCLGGGVIQVAAP